MLFKIFSVFLFLSASISLQAGNLCPAIIGPAAKLTVLAAEVLCHSSALGVPQNVENSLGTAYRLTKISDKKIKIEINPTFYAKKSELQESLWQFASRSLETQKEFIQKMNICFDRFKPFLIGPEGQSLEIAATEDKKVPAIQIKIRPQESRSSVKQYSESIPCETILHEVLHVLGLEDEYPETKAGFNKDPNENRYNYVRENPEVVGFDCRATGPEYSIMYDEVSALDSVLPLEEHTTKTCVCTQSEKVCENIFVKNRKKISGGSQCPKGYTARISSKIQRSKIDQMKFSGYSDEDIELNLSIESEEKKESKLPSLYYLKNGNTEFDLVTVKKLKPQRKSLLMPAHFRMVTSPNCFLKNQNYLKCTEGAYRNSMVHGSCSAEVKKCQSNIDWLH
ncbi:MAG: hypothetical protein V4596_08305 [Bdellovibrionota bacterium]